MVSFGLFYGIIIIKTYIFGLSLEYSQLELEEEKKESGSGFWALPLCPELYETNPSFPLFRGRVENETWAGKKEISRVKYGLGVMH